MDFKIISEFLICDFGLYKTNWIDTCERTYWNTAFNRLHMKYKWRTMKFYMFSDLRFRRLCDFCLNSDTMEVNGIYVVVLTVLKKRKKNSQICFLNEWPHNSGSSFCHPVPKRFALVSLQNRNGDLLYIYIYISFLDPPEANKCQLKTDSNDVSFVKLGHNLFLCHIPGCNFRLVV